MPPDPEIAEETDDLLAGWDEQPVVPPIVFNPEQSLALFTLQNWAEDKEQFACLLGSAGTGKTFLTTEFVRDQTKAGKRILMTAPTNKAVKVQFNMGMKFGLWGVEYSTIQKACGVKADTDQESGAQTFRIDSRAEPSIREYDIVVVDEASMVNEELYNFIRQVLRGYKVKVLFVGDPCQLPPVGEEHSRTFDITNTVVLNQIMRHDGPIAELVNSVRYGMKGSSIPWPQEENDKKTGVWTFDFQKDFVKRAIEDFKSPEWKESSDYTRIIAWTNQQVKEYNDIVHAALYGHAADPFLKGQRLIAKKAVVEGFNVLMDTSSECTVKHAWKGTYLGLDVWNLEVLTDNYMNLTVKVLDPEWVNMAEFERQREELKDAALRASHPYARKLAWKEFYSFINSFADLDKLFALTVHKAQGSTFVRTYADMINMCMNRTIKERQRLIYTAFTRASEQLCILV